MSDIVPAINLRPRILYHVAKAAWEGTLWQMREQLCQMVQEEFKDTVSRHQAANQIRIAMGLQPIDTDHLVIDPEALMGLETGMPQVLINPDACCGCPPDDRKCQKACPVCAISHDDSGKVHIDYDKCLGDGQCVQACSWGVLAEQSQFVPLIQMLRQQTHPVYVSMAPAFAGQFGPDVTPGKIRRALLRMGFAEMVETALYADLITMKEAFEFDHHVKSDMDFMITSCCCPIWIKLIENKFPDLMPHISPSVSPMVASARVIKSQNPNAKVVFIGPCIAKKTEATLPDLAGAVDYVLTFQELATLFEATGIRPQDEEDEENSQASWAGRVYARTGGVSAAVETTLQKLLPHKAKDFRSTKVDGVPDCQKLLADLHNGVITANFIEGMACKGGCVGGPARILSPEDGTSCVNEYGARAIAQTPVENPHVYGILANLNPDTQPDVLAHEGPMSQILARNLKKD